MMYRSSPSYAWVIVAMSFLAQFTGSGLIYYVFSVVVVPLSNEFSDGNRTPIILLQLYTGIVSIFLSPFVGRFAARGYCRSLLTAGMLATGGGLVLASQAHSLPVLGLIFSTLLAFGSSTLMGASATTMIVNWFDAKRGTAFGLSNVGASVAGVVLAPVAAMFLERAGWRGAFLWLGILGVVLAFVIWWLTVDRPIYYSSTVASAPEPARKEDMRATFLQANVWLIGLTGGLALMCSTAFLAHVVSFGRDIGLKPVDAAFLGSCFAAGGVAGKLLFGRLSDRIGVHRTFTIALLSSASAFLLLGFSNLYWATLLLVFLLAMGCSGALPLTNALVAASFDPREFGRMIGSVWPIVQGIILGGPLLVSLVYNYSGGYLAPFIMLASALVLAAIIVNFVRGPLRGFPVQEGRAQA